MVNYRGLTAVGLCLLVGCAGLTARKVPLNSRLSECDGDIPGFRYYLSRPYLVVSKQVSLGSEVRVGTLGYLGDSNTKLVLACPGPAGDSEYFSTDGEPIDGTTARKAGFKAMKIKATSAGGVGTSSPAPGVQPAAPASGGQPAVPAPSGLPAAPPPGGQAVPKPAVPALAAQPETIITAPPMTRTMTLSQLAAPVAGATSDSASTPAIEALSIVMLPDFEEQMAIDDCNRGAYSTYSLRFKNGWQLTTVNGSWDATTVPVDILKVLGTALQAAQDTNLAEQKAAASASTPLQQDLAFKVDTNVARAALIRREFIAPGMYKLLKAEERALGGHDPSINGYFSELGIPSQFEVRVKLISAE